MARITVFVLICAALTAGGAEARRRGADGDPASEAFALGTQLYSQMDYQGAIEAFQRAYTLKPHHIVMCNIARCYSGLNDMVKAADAYRQCLREGGGESKLAAKIADSLAKVEARITALSVTSVGQGGTVHVDGQAVGQTPRIVPLNPGRHVIEVRRYGAVTATATVEARGGQSSIELNPVEIPTRVAVQPSPEPARPASKAPATRRSRLGSSWFWVGAGTTAAVAAAATVMSVLTLRASNDFDEGPTWDGYDRVIDYRLVTNVLWGATAALGATTTVLFFFTDFGGSKRDRGDDAATLGIGITGSF